MVQLKQRLDPCTETLNMRRSCEDQNFDSEAIVHRVTLIYHYSGLPDVRSTAALELQKVLAKAWR